MGERFTPPHPETGFFDPDTNLEEMEEAQDDKQLVTFVRALRELPTSIRGQVIHASREPVEDGDTFVIKQYRLDATNLFPHGVAPDGEVSAAPRWTQGLVDRQERVRQVFEDDLPGIVQQSHFFIVPQEDGELGIYEVQKEMVDFETVRRSRAMLRDSLAKFTPEQRSALSEELKIFHKKYKEYIDFDNVGDEEKMLNEIIGKNIAITGDAHIRIFDTNSEQQISPKSYGYSSYPETLRAIEEMAVYLDIIGDTPIDELSELPPRIFFERTGER